MSCAAVAQSLPPYQSVTVNDFADALSNETERELQNMLETARAQRNHEVTVVTINWRSTYGDYADLARFGTALFNEWGVGDAEANDGVMLLFALKDQQMRIVLGDGYTARYDGIAKRIIDSVILPKFRVGEIEDGIVAGTAAALERLDLSQPLPPEPDPSLWNSFSQWVSDRIEAVMFAAFVFIASAFVWLRPLLNQVQRLWPRRCPECSTKMLRLGNVQERQYLTDAQILEESLDAKHYDVWICPKDEHVTVKGRRNRASLHKACPDCEYHTLEVHHHVREHPTRHKTGQAEQAKRCANCGYTGFAIVTLPMITDDNDHSVFGNRMGRLGGGGSSGGFGGGRSSGGGASGSW